MEIEMRSSRAMVKGVRLRLRLAFSTFVGLVLCAAALGCLAGCGSGSSNSPLYPNPTPTAASLSPGSAFAGGAAFTLTVTGTNFVPASTVHWNGSARTTTFVSSTSLQAAIPASDIATAGTAMITVSTPAPGGGTSNALTFPINNPPAPTIGSLSPSSAFAGGAAFTLTVTGTNFVPSSTVQWNGSARTTTFVSSTSLQAAIPASDIVAVGTAMVLVSTPAPGGGSSTSLTFTISPNPDSAITFFGASSTPSDNGTQAGATVSVTPPASMLAGDLVILIALNRDNVIGNMRLSNPGGQGWNWFQDAPAVTPSVLIISHTFYCRFNGTWAANPSIDLSNAAVTPFSVVMLVFRPSAGSKYWIPDFGPSQAAFTAPAAPFTVTNTGFTTLHPSTVSVAVWAAATANTWGTLSGAGWSQSGLSAQYRNTRGSGDSLAVAYNIRTTAGAVANVSLNESTSTAGQTMIFSLAEADLPSGGGTGSTGRIQSATFIDVSGTSHPTGISATFSSPVGSGHAVIGSAFWEVAEFPTPPYPSTITDDKSNTNYIILGRVESTNFGQLQILFFAPNLTNGPTTVTVNYNSVAGDSFLGMAIFEVDNAASFDTHTLSTIDHLAQGLDPEQQNSIPTVTPSPSNSYLVGFAEDLGNTQLSPMFTFAAPWNKVFDLSGFWGGADFKQGAPAPVKLDWTNNLGRDAQAIMGGFAPALGGVLTVPNDDYSQ